MKLVIDLIDNDDTILDEMEIEDIETYNFDKSVARGVVSAEIIEFIEDAIERTK